MIAAMASTGILSSTDMTGIVSFVSGLLSFFSPCILPLVPSYLIFISGITFDDYTGPQAKKYRKIVLIHSLAFILGFSFVFVVLGLSSSAIGSLLSNYQVYVMRIGGFILIILGLYYLDLVKIPFLNREKVFHLREKPFGLFGSFIVGITFSLGWTPCVGPALSSILIIASTTENIWEGVYLLSLYSLGLAIPFLISALIFDQLLGLLKKYNSIVRYSMKILGVLFVIIGVLFFSSLWGPVTGKIGQLLTP
jgi:cytochrome c-type biogenesis protein